MARVYYVDVAIPVDRKKRKRHKTHAVFDGVRVFRVNKLTELEDAEEIYIDAMFPQNYEEILDVIERGVKVLLLKNTRLLKRLRKKDRIRKSDENDAKLLSKMPRTCFRELTLKEVKLLQLINDYKAYSKWKRIIKQGMSLYPLNSFKECVKELRSLCRRYARRIIREVKSDKRRAMMYEMVCRELGLKKSVEVAILVARLPLNWKLSRLKGLLGFTPRKDIGYSHGLRANLSKLAASLYFSVRRKSSLKLFEGMDELPLNKALYILQLRILKILKKAWQQQRQCMLAGVQ